MADPQQPGIPGHLRLANAHHYRDLSLSPDGRRALSAHRVFVSDEVLLDVSFPAARARLASLIRGGLLGSASARAYGEGITGLARSGPPGPAPGLPGLVQVHAQDLTADGDPSRVALRWETAGPDGGVFPALDADITLAPAGEQAAALTLTGVYRPPPGTAGPGLDRAVVLRCATATIRAFLGHLIEAIAMAGEPGTEAAGPQAP
jgi:hypothetical protein